LEKTRLKFPLKLGNFGKEFNKTNETIGTSIRSPASLFSKEKKQKLKESYESSLKTFFAQNNLL